MTMAVLTAYPPAHTNSPSPNISSDIGPETALPTAQPSPTANHVPDPHQALRAIKALVLDSVSSLNSKRAYGKALDQFFAWSATARPGPGPFNKATVQAWRASLERTGLAPSTINIRLSAIRKLAREAADNELLPLPIADAIARIPGVPSKGVRTGNWLTRDQAQQLLLSPDPATLKGKRDRALLALMIGCGLRRNEVARLVLDSVQQRESRWVIVDLVGKHGRVRTVPMPGWTKTAIDDWAAAAGFTSGPVIRAMHKGDRIRHDSMTAQSIFEIVVAYGHGIGLSVAPHDLRRTFAKLAHRGRAALEQIQITLGHASILTTERYLGVRQDLSDAPCDHLGIDLME
jgi:integrase